MILFLRSFHVTQKVVEGGGNKTTSSPATESESPSQFDGMRSAIQSKSKAVTVTPRLPFLFSPSFPPYSRVGISASSPEKLLAVPNEKAKRPRRQSYNFLLPF